MLVSGAQHQPTPPSNTNSSTAAISGLKRKGDDDLENDQRLTRRFHLLNLGKRRHEITAEDIQNVHRRMEQNAASHDHYPAVEEAPRLRRSRSNAFSDTMNVDNSRDRIFIHNLEDELADLSSDEEHPIFIPDIERRLNMLPKSLLRPDHPPRLGNELVLYEVPTSLSIPVEQDGARKAILESRRRAQEHALVGDFYRAKASSPLLSDRALGASHANEDDAMDIS